MLNNHACVCIYPPFSSDTVMARLLFVYSILCLDTNGTACPGSSEDFELLIQEHNLTEEDCGKQVTDIHLEDISGSCCDLWRSLPSHLEIENLKVKDIDREHKGENEKRKVFFLLGSRRKALLPHTEC